MGRNEVAESIKVVKDRLLRKEKENGKLINWITLIESNNLY